MRLGRWLFGKGRHNTCIILGNDACGKTMLLYRLKLGEEVCTIPTIGFNIETIEYRGWKVDMWDIGGCDQIRPLIRHYIHADQFVLFVHDVTDEERLDVSIDYLHTIIRWMDDVGSHRMAILLNKQDALPSSQRAAIVNELKERFEHEISKYQDRDFKVLDTPGLSGRTGEQLPEVMDEIKAVFKSRKKLEKPKPSQANVKQPGKDFDEGEAVWRIKSQNANAECANDFWQSFLRADLPAWDHYTHLRAGYFVLLASFAKGSSVFECATEFLTHLGRLREKNPERFRNTAHKTLTVFWLVQLQVSTLRYQQEKRMDSLPVEDDFGNVLLSCPSLMNTSLWMEYYSKDVLFTQEARNDWHLPDLKPLPTLTSKATVREGKKVPASTTGNSDKLIEFSLAVIQKTLATKSRRGSVIKQALEALQTTTIRQRAEDPTIPPYSETQAYFWIQFTHAALASLEGGSSQVDGYDGPIAEALSFSAYKALFGISGDEWQNHYTASLWNSVSSRMSFAPPDKKPLPNIIGTPSQANVRVARSHIVEATARKLDEPRQLPTAEKLSFMVAVILEEAESTDTGKSAGDVISHTDLLLFLHGRLAHPPNAKVSPSANANANSHASETSRLLRRTLGTRAAEASAELTASLGVTAGIFWAQQVLGVMATANHLLAFSELMAAAPHLAYEDLPMAYYSPGLWHSRDARDAYVPPDLGSTRSIVPMS